MLRIDVNKSGRIFDFLVTSGMLILSYDPTVKHIPIPIKDFNGGFGTSGDLSNGHHHHSQQHPHSAGGAVAGGGFGNTGSLGQIAINGANGH
jgi:hypothetical protein